MKEVYLDNAAATFVDPRVKAVMDRFWLKDYGNPGSFHSMGLRALRAMNSARSAVANVLNCSSDEVVFTGCGTESVNLAIKGVFAANKSKGRHIITTRVEHPAVLEACRYLEKYESAKVTYLPVNKFGQVSASNLENAIRPDTILISVMYANNEIGTINHISELSKVAKKHNILFHTDACQAGLLDIDVKKLGVDLFSMNGSKVYAPKGVGLLFIRKSVSIVPLIHGGGQEFGLRSGTENVAFIVGFSKALQLMQSERKKESARVSRLRDKLVNGILNLIPKVILNGHPKERLAGNVNVSFLDIEGEALLLYLNEKGICASSGSACTSKRLAPSHVITALGLPYEVAHGSIRFTLGRRTTSADVDRVLKVLPGAVEALRRLSPVHIKEEDLYG
ncbi:MAG: aminotransferase class V-fold PLP-dependent enzyme [Candidatus Woesearchaeota archaeon]|nr:aminotransferase class V-fold PLP-dependent enzyme [Candidatus Woesearchaeota archaeon]